jgi:hypothetical protein
VGTWSPVRIGCALATVLLLGAGTVRASGWLFTLCVVVALPYASLAVAGGGRTWGRLIRGASALPLSVPAALGWAARSGAVPELDGGQRGRVRQLVAGTLAGVVLMSVFAALFAGANPAFAKLLTDSRPDLTFGGAVTWLLLFVVAAPVTLVAAYLRTNPAPPSDEWSRERRMLTRLEWAVPVALVDLVFAVFVWTEGEVMFGGYRYVLGRGGPTFSQYASTGFWQLTLVTLLSLGILAVLAYRASGSGIRLLGGALGVLTLVVVASALFRMATYVQAYGYTRVRLLGFGVELVLGLVVLLVLVAGVRLRGGWLPGAVAGLVVTSVLGLVVVNPDAVIARTIIGRYQQDGHLDGFYLSQLSADAIPEIDRLPEPFRSCVLKAMDHSSSTMDGWSAYNYGRASGRAVLRSRPPAKGIASCAYVIHGPHDGD